MDVSSKIVNASCTGHHLLVPHLPAMVDQRLCLRLDLGGVACDPRKRAAPHQLSEQDER